MPFDTYVDKASGAILMVVVNILLAMIILVPIVGCLMLAHWLVQSSKRPTFGRVDDAANKV